MTELQKDWYMRPLVESEGAKEQLKYGMMGKMNSGTTE